MLSVAFLKLLHRTDVIRSHRLRWNEDIYHSSFHWLAQPLYRNYHEFSKPDCQALYETVIRLEVILPGWNCEFASRNLGWDKVVSEQCKITYQDFKEMEEPNSHQRNRWLLDKAWDEWWPRCWLGWKRTTDIWRCGYRSQIRVYHSTFIR